jgi:tryptophan synthase beta subunit
MNKAIPFKTAVGGTCCKESALFIKSKTIEKRKKQVTKIKILGAKVKIVNKRSTLIEKATS